MTLYDGLPILILLIKLFLVFNIIMGLASFCTWFERKGSALIQDRIGANRAGANIETDIIFLKPIIPVLRVLGILGIINTLLCDAVKALSKEDFVPEGVSNFLHSLAPFLAVAPIFVAFGMLPLAPDFSIYGYPIRAQLAPVSGAILFIFAMGAISVYGVALAGTMSNNKFSLLGALRASAQMISYEIPMGLSFVTMVLLYGTIDIYGIIDAQKGLGWGLFLQPVAFFALFIAGMAETKRGPFDLPESESELVAGYFTEYSGMKFLIFWLGEFAEIALFGFLMSILFLGGWHLPFVELPDNWIGALIGHGILMAKVLFMSMLQIVIRWTLPRFRYDQLMDLGWKLLIPVCLVNLLATATVKLWLAGGF
jgi:NADH-quinone oxidoreductase subunit H